MKLLHDMYKEDEKNYCECCLQPAGTAIKPYHACCKAETMDSTGSGIPLFFMMQKYFLRIIFSLGVIFTASSFIPDAFNVKISDLVIPVENGKQYV